MITPDVSTIDPNFAKGAKLYGPGKAGITGADGNHYNTEKDMAWHQTHPDAPNTADIYYKSILAGKVGAVGDAGASTSALANKVAASQ